MAEPVPSDRLIGYRMNADRSFADRLHESPFSSAEWDVLMSVVSFEIAGADDPETAELRAVYEDLDAAVAATKEVAAADPYGQPSSTVSGGSNLIDRFVSRFRGGDDGDRREEAEVFIGEYTAFLEGLLRQDDAWADLCSDLAD